MSNTATVRPTDLRNVSPENALIKHLRESGTDISTIRVNANVADKVLAPTWKERFNSVISEINSLAETWVTKVQGQQPALENSVSSSTDIDISSVGSVATPQTPKKAVSTLLGSEAAKVVSFSAHVKDSQNGPEAEEKGKWRSDILEKGERTHSQKANEQKQSGQSSVVERAL